MCGRWRGAWARAGWRIWDLGKALVKLLIIVDDSWARASVWPQTIMHYHWLSFSLSLFKFFIIVDDSFSRLTTRMIVHDSFSVSCFGNHWPDSGQKTCSRPLSSGKFILLQVCLTEHHLVFIFLHRRSLELAVLVTLLARLPVNYHQLSRPFDHVNMIVGDSWW